MNVDVTLLESLCIDDGGSCGTGGEAPQPPAVGEASPENADIDASSEGLGSGAHPTYTIQEEESSGGEGDGAAVTSDADEDEHTTSAFGAC